MPDAQTIKRETLAEAIYRQRPAATWLVRWLSSAAHKDQQQTVVALIRGTQGGQVRRARVICFHQGTASAPGKRFLIHAAQECVGINPAASSGSSGV